MALFKYRTTASSPWQVLKYSVKMFASEVFTSRDKTVEAELDEKVNHSDVLSFEEIAASTDLMGKVASAQALRDAVIKTQVMRRTGITQAPGWDYWTMANLTIPVGYKLVALSATDNTQPGETAIMASYTPGKPVTIFIYNRTNATYTMDVEITAVYVKE